MKFINIFLDFRKIEDKKDIHSIIKEEFGFPDYYGNNLDAINDLISESSKKYNVVILTSIDNDVEGSYIKKIMDVFDNLDNVKYQWIEYDNKS